MYFAKFLPDCIISKLGFQPNKVNVGVETPTYDCRVANNDCSLCKGLYTLTRFSNAYTSH